MAYGHSLADCRPPACSPLVKTQMNCIRINFKKTTASHFLLHKWEADVWYLRSIMLASSEGVEHQKEAGEFQCKRAKGLRPEFFTCHVLVTSDSVQSLEPLGLSFGHTTLFLCSNGSAVHRKMQEWKKALHYGAHERAAWASSDTE